MESEKRELIFAVNGQRFELSNLHPSTTLLEFLRTQTKFKGPKLGCGEGGCGACVVLLSTYDPRTDQVKDYSISSCLTLLYSLNFCSITTAEGLGNSKDGFHSIHKRMAGFHASQCGFCTPGMCMSLFSALKNAEKDTDRPQPPVGLTKITADEAEKAIAGNICRCTGFRPLLDVCKSFASDVDLEDLGLNTFWNKVDTGSKIDRLPVPDIDSVCTFPEFLKSEIKSSTNALSSCPNSSNWYCPDTFDDLYELLNSQSFSESRVKIVVSNTGSGIYKEKDLYDKYVDLKGIPELTSVQADSGGVVIGAAVSISRTIKVLKEQNEMVFTKLSDHMNKVATAFVRNTASLGGNLMMAQRLEFDSDIATILLAAGSSVVLQTPSERLVITLEEFLERPPCDEKTILVSIQIPRWNSLDKSSILFETYRAAVRPLGNAVSYLNCAFLAEVSVDKTSGICVLESLRLAFGAYGVEHAIRAKNVEDFLVGKHLMAEVLLRAITLLKETIVPREGTRHSSYRTSLAVAFLFKFLQPLCKDLKEPMKSAQVDVPKTSPKIEHFDGSNGVSYNKMENSDGQVKNKKTNLPLNSKQDMEFSKKYQPVGEPVKKVGAELQASGEAIYVDDIPSPKDCLYGAFVYSTRPMAHINNISFSSSLASTKLVNFFTVDGILKEGNNVIDFKIFGKEPLFASSLTEYAGQPLGLVLAESQRLANLIAKQAKVNYSTENLEPPILSVEDAVKRSSFFKIPPYLTPKGVGDLSKGMQEADHKIISAEVNLGSQYYFYMETQTAFAVPDEDNCMVIYSSSQFTDYAQGMIARCLGIPENNVRLITRRVGGGFGGKAFRAMQVATACALAAFTLRRPVRMYLDRQTDMIMVGGRHPMTVKYSIGFQRDGKITALDVVILMNAGITEDFSPLLPLNMIAALKKYNWGAFSFDVKLCKTNLTTKSAMRAPGEVQGSFIAEAIIEHVASFLSMDAISVRRKNLHTVESLKLSYEHEDGDALEYTLPSMVDEIISLASYYDRLEAIRDFNSSNKWKKQGISLVPCIYQVNVKPTRGRVSVLNDGSIVVEVGGIEIGQGLWTKVRQMTAFALGQLWPNGNVNLLERIRVVQNDSLSLIQGGMTSGSTTSEASCEAVRLCCNVLVDRLKSLKDRLDNDTVPATWDSLISQASLQSVNLSASTYWVPEKEALNYLNYGVAISEVQVDVLTGALTILRSDIGYDCGQSLNPAVDLGQIEGAFVQGIGFFMYEECLTNADGLVTTDGTWTYKVPTIDTIPKQFNVKILNSGHHQKRVLSSKASGEPPLVLAASVHCATREAIRAARKEFSINSPSTFQMNVPTIMPYIKELCGLQNVEKYLQSVISSKKYVKG